MESRRFLILNWGGFGGVRRGSLGFGRSIERQRIYRFDSRDNMRHHYFTCPSSSIILSVRSPIWRFKENQETPGNVVKLIVGDRYDSAKTQQLSLAYYLLTKIPQPSEVSRVTTGSHTSNNG
eukprot:8482882-Pyramimonas_sp.AAC.1